MVTGPVRFECPECKAANVVVAHERFGVRAFTAQTV